MIPSMKTKMNISSLISNPEMRRFDRIPSLSAFLLLSMGMAASAKDPFTNVNGATVVEVPPPSNSEIQVDGPYTGPGGITDPFAALYLTSSGLGEWWVNDDSFDPWTDLQASTDQLAYHHRADVGAGENFWVAWSLDVQYFDYTSSFRQNDGQIPNGSIISFGLSNGGGAVSLRHR